jgi:hypothetical protein
MQKTTVKSPHHNVLHIRLDEELRARLQEAADAHRFPLIREIRHRLIDSFDTPNKRRYEIIAQEIEILLVRLGALCVDIGLGKQLAEAVANDADQKEIKDLARLIIARHAARK